MVRIFRGGRRNRDSALPEPVFVAPVEETSVQASRIPPPANPVELGLTLRTARERTGLSLEQVRDRIEVPLVDLNAIERGSLGQLHLEQAAVVAIFRYAELLGLDPDALVGVTRAFWPNPALSIDAFRGTSGSNTPMTHLAAARQLLRPIAEPRALSAPGSTIGLSRETLESLSHAIGKSSLGLELGGPPLWSTPALGASTDSTAAPTNWDDEPVYTSYEGEVAKESYAAIADVPLSIDGEDDTAVAVIIEEAALEPEPVPTEATPEPAEPENYQFGSEYRFTD